MFGICKLSSSTLSSSSSVFSSVLNAVFFFHFFSAFFDFDFGFVSSSACLSPVQLSVVWDKVVQGGEGTTTWFTW